MELPQFGERRQSCRNNEAFLLAVLYTIGFLTMVYALFTWKIPDENKEICISIVSVMATIQTYLCGYFYGASKTGSETAERLATNKQRADETISEIAKTATGSPTDTAPTGSVHIQASGDIKASAKKGKA